MTHELTTAEKKALINEYIMDESRRDTMINLYERWQDEREHEDFNDYVKIMVKGSPLESILVKGTKRPFGFLVSWANGRNVQIFLKVRRDSFNLSGKMAK